MFPVVLRDPSTLRGGQVTKNGEIIVAALDYSTPYYKSIIAADTVYNIVPAMTGRIFIMTGLFVSTKKSVIGEATVQIFEALSSSSSVHESDIVNMDMVKNERETIPISNAATDSTRWINIISDKTTVNITIWGYYADA